MDLALMGRVLAMRGGLRRRDRWDRAELDAHRERRLRELRRFAVERSPFYRRLHAGLEDAPLDALPTVTKAELAASFDEVVTDRGVRLADVEAHLRSMAGDARFRGRYRVVSTSGTTGVRGVFLSDAAEWAALRPSNQTRASSAFCRASVRSSASRAPSTASSGGAGV